MPIVNHDQYIDMIDRAKAGGFAYPAVNVRSSVALHAALRGFAEAGSDGIIQVTVRSTEFWSGSLIRDRVAGAVAFADFARAVAANYPVNIALHTDHCPQEDLDTFLRPLIAVSQRRVAQGDEPLFQSYMWDGSAMPLDANLRIADDLLAECAKASALLEVEIGVVGGEEEGLAATGDAKLFSTPEDALRLVRAMGDGERGRYLVAATFGNVHGVYKPGNVRLRPAILADLQRAVAAEVGRPSPLNLVFHGGSGSSRDDMRQAITNGTVKVNIDTDTQYAFTRAIAHHMFANYDGVLKVDGEVGRKKVYDDRSYLEKAEMAMAERVSRACRDLGSANRSTSPS
ncbi:class II fructose-bisphosphate aldolase [Micromonospora echinospora]|uniref:class II fructose-bisphosphate aldolase n=1 Tax=Micromonospora echinospora TaxID=1877 RepID=UPI003CFA4AAA